MTEQEAKEYMENEIRCIQRASYCDHDCAKCELVKEEEPLLEAFGMAIKALEKQVPKKPTDAGKFADLYVGLCSVCNEGVNSQMNYCDKCGQKLDWEGR